MSPSGKSPSKKGGPSIKRVEKKGAVGAGKEARAIKKTSSQAERLNKIVDRETHSLQQVN